MHNTHELIELAKQRLALKHGLDLPMTDYRLAKLMNLKQSTVSAWRVGKSHIGTEFAAQFAEVCELPGAYVYACVKHERAKNDGERSILEAIADAFRGKAAAIAAILAVTMLGNAGISGTSDASAPRNVYYGKRRTKRRGGYSGQLHQDPSVRYPTQPATLQGDRLLSFYHRWRVDTFKPPLRRAARAAVHA